MAAARIGLVRRGRFRRSGGGVRRRRLPARGPLLPPIEPACSAEMPSGPDSLPAWLGIRGPLAAAPSGPHPRRIVFFGLLGLRGRC